MQQIATTVSFAQSPASAQISIRQITPVLTPGGTAEFVVEVVNALNLAAYQFDVQFDPELLTARTTTVGTMIPTTDRTVSELPIQIDATTGKVSLGVFSFGSGAGGNGNGILYRLTFDVVSTGTSTLATNNLLLINTSGTEQAATTTPLTISVTTAQATPTPVPSQLPEPSTSPTPSATPAPNENSRLTLSLPTPLVTIGQEFGVDLTFTTQEPVAGVDAIVLFDNTKLKAVTIDDKKLLAITPKSEIDNENGTLKISQVSSPTEGFSGNGTLATITFQALEIGEQRVSFQYTPSFKKDSNAISFTSGQDILAEPADLVFNVTEKSTLQIQLQTPSENTEVGNTIEGQLQSEDGTFSATLSANPQGLTQAIELNQSLLGRVSNFFFKASGYLRRRFALTPTPGGNTVNLGLLKAGDLNDNGIINDDDLAVMYQNWYRQGLPDFNYDGVTNSADYWIITQNYLAVDE